MAEFECRLKKYRQMKDLTQGQLAVDISRVVEAPIEEIFIFE